MFLLFLRSQFLGFSADNTADNIIVGLIVCIFMLSLFFVFPPILKKYFYHVVFNLPSFNDRYKFNKNNLRFAYKIAGCHIVVADNGDRRGQYLFLISYLKRKFPGTGSIDLKVIPEIHHSYPEIHIVYNWLSKHLNDSQKLQFIDYLVDLAFYNKKLSSREMRLIYLAGTTFGYSKKEVKSILSIRYKFYQDKEQRERKHRRKTRTTRGARRSKKNEAYKILGISDFSTSFDEVKKAYRDQAKKYHPDRFYNSSEEEQEKANERFAVINNAYDYLETVLT